MFKYKTTGIVKYKTNNWIVIEADPTVVNYYKWWIERFTWKKISTSYHGPHITVLAGKHEKPKSLLHWGKYHDEKVEVFYDGVIHCNEFYVTENDDKGKPQKFKAQYFWLRVDCPKIAKIREQLGLKPKLKFETHLTIGYLRH